jgi:hypothetical protein
LNIGSEATIGGGDSGGGFSFTGGIFDTERRDGILGSILCSLAAFGPLGNPTIECISY